MYFDDLSKIWDDEKRIERARIIANRIKETVRVSKDNSAMEFGCGTGLISFNLINDFQYITLIDNSQGMIDVVNEKIKKLNLNYIKSYCIDLMKSSLSEEFDLIYTSMALHHVLDIDAIIGKLYNMINLGGKVCIVDLNEEDGRFHKNEIGFNGHNGFSQKWMKNVLETRGFCNVTSETFYEGVKQVDDGDVQYSLFIMTGQK